MVEGSASAERAQSCGCAGPPRRLCDLCEARGESFLACSLACLDRHREAAHGGLSEGDSAERARRYARELNQRFPDSWAGYAGHREHLAALISELPLGGELCVFGAGNCNDLQLERLSEQFSEVHLVDLDGEALVRARDRQGSAVRAKITLHADVDCSGMIDLLDAWGEHFPDRAELGRSAVAAAQAIVRGLGRNFPAVVSACVLSQLAVPFQRAWVKSRANWGDLLGTISAIHLATLAGSVRPGGRGLIVCDVASSKDSPALAEQRGRGAEELQEFVESTLAQGGLQLRPDPRALQAQLSSPGLRALVEDVRVGPPWLWHLGVDTQLVYSVSFGHPQR